MPKKIIEFAREEMEDKTNVNIWRKKSWKQYLMNADIKDVARAVKIYRKLQENARRQLPTKATGAVLADTADSLHALLARDAQLELSLEAFARDTANLPTATETERLVVQRIGQNQLRTRLLQYWRRKCAVTGLALPKVLRTSHIKPWRDCADAHERLTIYNALLLSPHLDALFDQGFITFSDDGEIRMSPRLLPAHQTKLSLPPHENHPRGRSAYAFPKIPPRKYLPKIRDLYTYCPKV